MNRNRKRQLFQVAFVCTVLLITGTILWIGYKYNSTTFNIQGTYHWGQNIVVTGSTVPWCKVVIYFTGFMITKQFSTVSDSNGQFSFTVNIPYGFNPQTFGLYPVFVEVYDYFGIILISRTSNVTVSYLP